jgi:hypothetical protein
MKSIINGRIYDTEKACLVGEATSNHPRNDFGWWAADLYRTPRSGRYFLAGEGGPMTRWGRRVGDMTGYGEGIIPLEAHEALEWAEQYLSTKEVEAAFGEVLEEA